MIDLGVQMFTLRRYTQTEAELVPALAQLHEIGYRSIQVTIGQRRASLVNKPVTGHYAKAGVEAGEGLWELRLPEGEDVEAGSELNADMFEAGELVDVTGTSKGKGFQGAVKRWNFSMQDATHGNSLSHRAPGSIGQCQTPGRVFKGKKMSGHMGAERVTTQGLEVVRVDVERNLLLIKGAVPGAKAVLLLHQVGQGGVAQFGV